MQRAMLLLLMITLSGFSSLSGAAEEYWEYSFRPGDTIWKIAEQYTDSVDNWQEIQRINNIGSGRDRQILPGARIKVPVHMLKRQPVPANVIAVSGDATLIRSSGESLTIRVGEKLYSGDRVLTAAGQSLRIQFADKSELQVLANSEIKLDKLSYHEKTGMVDTRVRLQQGRVNTWVEKLKPKSRYQIQAPAALTAVRGTQYRLSSDADQISRTEVTEGLVGVSAGGEAREVKSGFGLVVEKDQPLPDPVRLLDAPQISDNLSSTYGQLRLTWTALEGAAEYRYQLSNDPTFDNILVNRSTTRPDLSISELEGGSYYLRVRAIDNNRLQGLDAVRNFQVVQAPPNTGAAEKVIIPSGILILGQ